MGNTNFDSIYYMKLGSFFTKERMIESGLETKYLFARIQRWIGWVEKNRYCEVSVMLDINLKFLKNSRHIGNKTLKAILVMMRKEGFNI